MPLIGNTEVPSQYVADVNNAAAATGLPAAVVAAQINDESGFQPGVTSSAGAQGIAQFLPSTFAAYGHGSAYNAQDAFAAYANYMNTLLKQFNGNVRDALAAYNAGPGNIGAGMGYANTILSNAGASPNTRASGGSGGSRGTGGVRITGSSGSQSSTGTSGTSDGTTTSGVPDPSSPGGIIGFAEGLPFGLGNLVKAIEPLLHAFATVIDYSFMMFQPGQGFRLLFGIGAIVMLFFSYRILSSSGGASHPVPAVVVLWMIRCCRWAYC